MINRCLVSMALCLFGTMFVFQSEDAIAADIKMASGPVCGDVVEDNGEPLYALPKDDMWGYVTRDGSWAIPPQWSRAEPFSEGLAAVSAGGAFGIIDREGNYVLEPLLASIRPFSEGCAAAEHFHERSRYLFVSRDGSFWHYDSSPEGAPAKGFEGFGDFSEGKAWFKIMDHGREPNEYGWIDTAGKIVIPRRYSGAGNFVNGLAPAAQGGEYWAYMDETGEPRLPDRWRFQKMLPFSEGLAAVRINVFTWMYMSSDGIAIKKITFKNPGRARKGPPGEADDIGQGGSFHDGLAAVKPRWALDDEEVIFIRPDGSEAFAPTRDFDLTLYCAMGRLPEYRNGLVRLLVSNSGKKCSNTGSTRQSRPYYDDAHYVYLDTDGNIVIEQSWGEGDTEVTP